MMMLYPNLCYKEPCYKGTALYQIQPYKHILLKVYTEYLHGKFPVNPIMQILRF